MILPCTTCKYKKEVTQGHRSFVGCVDKEKEKANFHEDNYFYHHSCDAYEKEEKESEE